MKKIIFFLLILAAGEAFAGKGHSFYPGQFVSWAESWADSLGAKPTNADSIRFTMYDSSSTTVVLTRLLTQFNSETGEYVDTFTYPAAAKTMYNYRIKCYDYGSATPFRWSGEITTIKTDTVNIKAMMANAPVKSDTANIKTAMANSTVGLSPATEGDIADSLLNHTYNEFVTTNRVGMVFRLLDSTRQMYGVGDSLQAIHGQTTAIKTQTDKFSFGSSNEVLANIKSSDTVSVVLDVVTKSGYSLTSTYNPPTNFSLLKISAGGYASPNFADISGQLDSANTAARFWRQPWQVDLSGTWTAGTSAALLKAAGVAADPWTAALPGAYGAGTAGNIIGNRLDFAISTRYANTDYVRMNYGMMINTTTAYNLSGTLISNSNKFDLNTNAVNTQTVSSGAFTPYKFTANDTGRVISSVDNTTVQFRTNLPITIDNFYKGRVMKFLSGNNKDYLTNIVAYAGTTKLVTIRPGLLSGGANANDSIAIFPERYSVEPMPDIDNGYATNLDVNGSGMPPIDIDASVGTLDSTQFATGDNDSSFTAFMDRHGGGTATIDSEAVARAAAAGVWDTTIVPKAQHFITGDFSGVTASIPDSVTARIDSILNSLGRRLPNPETPGAYYSNLQEAVGAWNGSTDNLKTLIETTVMSTIDSCLRSIGWYGMNGVSVPWDSTNSIQKKLGGFDTAIMSVYSRFNDMTVAACAGNASTATRVYVRNPATGTMITNASVTVATAGGQTYPGISTNSQGFASFAIDTSVYYVTVVASGYLQSPAPDTFHFTGANYDTIGVTSSALLMVSSNPELCRTYVQTKDFLDVKVAGATFTVTPVGSGPWYKSDSTLIVLKSTTAKTDTSGVAYVDLYPSSSVATINGTELKYNFSFVKTPYFQANWTGKTVPDTTGWRLR